MAIAGLGRAWDLAFEQAAILTWRSGRACPVRQTLRRNQLHRVFDWNAHYAGTAINPGKPAEFLIFPLAERREIGSRQAL
ncbi:hypothetical protein FJ960_24740 [Mesorhizobium sp. B2-3-11]|nr:hypothetical protein FJ960_24740 [Mesorhizobium sp. B2-3-11]